MKADVRAEAATLRDWMLDAALPLWAERCVDRGAGGFFERLTPEGAPIDDPRRARLAARQVYVFDRAAALGWRGPAADLRRHALAALDRHVPEQGLVVSTLDRDRQPVGARFDLYDHAFTLFAFAVAIAAGIEPEARAARARRLHVEMRAAVGHPISGFEEAAPRSLPLRANPHMHLLEASLALAAADPGGGWNAMADGLAELALARFIDPATGAVHELYDGDWRRLDGAQAIVEPGHQFEWAWLLMRWGDAARCPEAESAAARLIALGEAHGVRDGLALNELDASLHIRDARARLWPQTERVKALALQAMRGGPEQEDALNRAIAASAGLRRFFAHPVTGSYYEHIGPDGVPLIEPARASSLYHIMGAVEAMVALDAALT